MASPSAADFAALARSSPWLWSTLTFTLRWRAGGPRFDAVRAYLRRPDLLRVETLGGELIQIIQEPPRTESADGVPWGQATVAGPAMAPRYSEMTSPPGRTGFAPVSALGLAPAPRPDLSPSAATARPGSERPQRAQPGLAPQPTPRPDHDAHIRTEPAPEFRPDRLVARRSESEMIGVFDVPMFQNYYWVALLDPVELADGRDPRDGARCEGTVINDVTQVEHAGGRAWQATVRPGDAYEPRCGCCSLMRDRRIDRYEWGDDHPDVLLAKYPTGYRVRVDCDTGVCVLCEALDGSDAGQGHEAVIEAVDTDLPDALFTG